MDNVLIYRGSYTRFSLICLFPLKTRLLIGLIRVKLTAECSDVVVRHNVFSSNIYILFRKQGSDHNKSEVIFLAKVVRLNTFDNGNLSTYCE